MKVRKKRTGPVLVGRETPAGDSPPEKEIAPNGTKSQGQKSAAPIETGDPDHSLVPAPSKRLLEPAEFFRYWLSIPQRERQAWFIGYVYRKYPICDVLQPLSEEELRLIQRKQKKAPESNCGKVAEPLNPDSWEREVYEKWGAGDYYIRLNDTHSSVRGTVTETQIRGLRDWDKFPPILKVEEVVLDEPLNQPYLRWARLHGLKFPNDPGYINTQETTQEENDMAVQATVDKLADALIDVTSRPVQQQAPVVAAAPDRSNDILADAALKGQQILLDSIKAQSKAQDPMEFHKAVTEAAKAMAPPPAMNSSGPGLVEMMGLFQSTMATLMAPMMAANQAILEEAKSRAAAAERRAEMLEQRIMNPPAPVAAAPAVGDSDPVKNAIALLKGLGSLKDHAGSLLGSDGAVDADMPVWARIASKALDAAPGMLHNIAVIRTGNGAPAPPDELNPALLEAEGQQPAAPANEPKGEDEVITDKRIAMEIAGPLIKALNEGHRGFEFAAGMMLTPRILGFPGRAVYELAVEQGPDGMYRILQSYPELWQKLVRIPTQFGQFMTEFFDRAQAEAVIQAAKNSQPVPQPAPAPAPAPAVAVTPEVIPPPKHRGGRMVVNPADGKPVHTAPVVDTKPV